MPPKLTDVVRRGGGHPTPTLLRGHEGSMAFVAFLSNNQIISASDEDMTVRRWNLSDGRSKIVKELMVCATAISPNKRWLAFGGRDGRIRLLDLGSSTEEVKKSTARHTDIVSSVSFSPDSSRLASGAQDGKLLVWSATSLEQVAEPIKGHKDSVWCVSYSPDGTKIASCDRETIQIWDSMNITWIGLTIYEQAWSLAWSSAGNYLFAGCIDGTIKRYDPHSGTRLASYTGHCDVVSSISLSHNAKFIATASWDKTVRLWEATTFQQIGPSIPHDARLHSISISPDNGHLVSGARDSNVRVWNLRTIAPALFSFFPLEPNRRLIRNSFRLPWGKPTKDLELTADYNSAHDSKARTQIQIPASGSGGISEATVSSSSQRQTSYSRDILDMCNRNQDAKIDYSRTPTPPTTQGSSSPRTDIDLLKSDSPCDLALSPSSVKLRREVGESEDRGFIQDIRSNPTHDLTGRIASDGINLISGGAYSDIYKGMLIMNGKAMQVAIKAIKNFTAFNNDQFKRQCLHRQIKLSLQLDHRNVLPLLGTTDNYGEFPAMVYPWIENGTLAEFFDRKNDLTKPLRLCIVNDVALGLQYLHSESVVHGNISDSNVLVHGSGRACIADFGLSVAQTEIEGTSLTLTYQAKATIRWTAPELLGFHAAANKCENTPEIFPTVQSDIYSFAGIMLRVLSGNRPYHDYPHDEQVIDALSRGELPRRPPWTAVVTDDQWDFMMQCWSVEAADRPCDSEVVSFVHDQLLDAVVASGESMWRIHGGSELVRDDQMTTSSKGFRWISRFSLDKQ